MKRSELPLLFPGIVLLLAAAAYALLFFTSRAEDVPSAVCTAALWQDTLSLKGVVSRSETPVSAPEGAVYPLVPDGERVAAGAPVALAGETGAELFRAALLLRVRVELASDMLPVPGGQALRSLSEALAGGTFPRSAQPCRRRAVRSAMPRRRQRPPPGGGSAPFLRSGRDARPRPARGIFLRARGGRAR